MTLQLTMTKKDLAQFLAIRPETLSRLIRQLESEALISWQQEALEILSIEALSAE
ncbi:helix-turn-helix domain-containing protein [Suttonella ornithocola]|uniref:helix-turn-helix domain-containing protein n=1 Tax=Suttonella ornithocola TaxID=279832 RepID=UPI002482F5E1|nr:helix-turn-helix domain-containing protein [Suttonella ornithocola]